MSQTHLLSRRSLIGAAVAMPAVIYAGTGRRADVIVVGAGLSGLAAARKLEAAGFSVLVLEAQRRVGGRTYTGRDLPDRPEYGGVQVGGSYGRLRSAAAALGVAIAPFPHRFPAPIYHIDGRNVSGEEWPQSTANRLPPAERATPPSRLLYQFLGSNPLGDVAQWAAPPAGVDISLLAQLQRAGASAEAIRLITVNANNNGLDSVSAIAEWRSALLRSGDRRSEVMVDGSDALARAMAQRLSEPVRYDHAVRRIDVERGGVQLHCANGERFKANQVICTIPPPVLRRVELNAELPAATRTAIDGFAFTRISQILIDAEPFWDEDGLSPYIWSDGPLERLFPRIASNGEIVGFKAWLNGAGASAVDVMSDQEVNQLVGEEMVRMRPASQGKLRVVKRISWANDPCAGGAYPEWLAGKVADYANAFRAPLGGLHFAGDFTSRFMTGMEGAFEGGERAADAVLAALRPAASKQAAL